MITETPSPPKTLTKSDQWLDLVKAFEHRDVIAAKAFTKNDQWLVLVKETIWKSSGNHLETIWKTNLKISGPAGRPAGRAEVPPYPMAGKFFHPPHPPTQVQPRI